MSTFNNGQQGQGQGRRNGANNALQRLLNGQGNIDPDNIGPGLAQRLANAGISTTNLDGNTLGPAAIAQGQTTSTPIILENRPTEFPGIYKYSYPFNISIFLSAPSPNKFYVH